MKKRALLSVYDKNGICDFAERLEACGYEIIATAETLREIRSVCETAVHVAEITGYDELLGGRVRLEHPAVYAGILAMRSDIEQMNEIIDKEYEPIDVVAVNIPEFTPGASEDMNEFSGDMAVLRSAVKNCSDVAVIIDPADYDTVIDELSKQGEVSGETKLRLAYKVLEFTAHYDAGAAAAFRERALLTEYPRRLSNPYIKVRDLKCGENSQQTAAFYADCSTHKGTLADAEFIKGTADTYTRLLNLSSAVETIKEFDAPAAVIIRGGVPCGGGTGDTVCDAFIRAYRTNTGYVAGSVVSFNRQIDRKTALELAKFTADTVIAPSFDAQALEILEKKDGLCLVRLENIEAKTSYKIYDVKRISGGVLVQSPDIRLCNQNDLQCVTLSMPDEDKTNNLMLAWRIAKTAKSNAAVAASDSRILKVLQCMPDTDEAVRLAASFSEEAGAVIACDAPLSSPDTIPALSRAGICAIIQPGGTANDMNIIEACNEHGIAMLVTNMTHIKN